MDFPSGHWFLNVSYLSTESLLYGFIMPPGFPLTVSTQQTLLGQPGGQWLTPVILASQEAELRRIVVQSQPRQTVQETLS
jgi:hypothetical protein